MRIIWLFFKGLFLANFSISLMIGGLGALDGGVDGYLKTFAKIFLTIGFALTVFFYNLRYKNYYFFYYNNHFSKISLYVYTSLLNLVVVGLIFLIKYLIGWCIS